MSAKATHELDASVREANLQLESLNFTAPEIFLLLGTGVEDLTRLLEDCVELSMSELSSCPPAWKDRSLFAGRVGGVRVWALSDDPEHDPVAWARAWPIWLARAAGAGACLITTAGIALPEPNDPHLSEGFLFVSDHLVLGGESPLRGLSQSNLGPLFPDQGRVHDAALRASLLKKGRTKGLPCSEGVLACVPGPSLETPAEREYYNRAGADASAQNLGGVLHAMAHCGLGGVTLVTLLGGQDSSIERMLESSSRLAPGLAELIETSIDPLATRARDERREEL